MGYEVDRSEEVIAMVAAKMMKWMPWPVLSTQKFQLGLVLHELEGLCLNGGSDKLNLMVHIKWKGSRGKLGSRFRSVERNCTAMRTVGDKGTVEWNESFDHACVLTMLRGSAFHRWDVAFEVINAPENDLNSRLSVVGTAFLNIAEFVSYGKNMAQTNKIPFSCCVGGATTEAALVVTLNFIHLQNDQEPFDPVQKLLVPLSCIIPFVSEKDTPKRPDKYFSDEDGSVCKQSPRSEECESADLFDSESTEEGEVDEAMDGDDLISGSYDTLAAANLSAGPIYLDCKEYENGDNELTNSGSSFDSLPKLIDEPSSPDSDLASQQPAVRKLLSWKKRKFSFKSSPKARGEPLLNKAYGEEGGDDIDFHRRQSGSPNDPFYFDDKGKNGVNTIISAFGDDQFTIGSWEQKDIVSRDGQMKLSAQVFFGSIDQRSERAAGESACTALVAVIADWLHSNPNTMPIKSQYDMLIREGSQEWRGLCDVDDYKERFPDRHFDLDTVLQAKIRPLSVVPEKSFVGFFRPEGMGDSFDFLQGAMSFDNIWDEITKANMVESQNNEPQIYIVSWNDHFFLLKVEKEAFYIIDTLGERLFEGCNQAYILKFDQETALYQLLPKDQKKEEEKSAVSEKAVTAKDSKSTATKDSKPTATKDAKSSAAKDAKSTAAKDSKSAVAKDSKSVSAKDSKSTIAENSKSSTAEVSKSPGTDNAIQQNQEKSVVEIGDTKEPETSKDDNDEKLICKGKESCKAFINGFLAALPLRELQVDMEKGLMGKISLHHRLQIEFHLTAQ